MSGFIASHSPALGGASWETSCFVERTRRRPKQYSLSRAAGCTVFASASFAREQTSGGADGSGGNPLTRFALISDVHVFDQVGIWREDVTDFSLHRLLGLANIVFMRGPGKYSIPVLQAALEDMRAQGVQHLVCAGDVTNLAMESEFALAQSFFEKFGPDSSMSFCPGNHDIYVPAQVKGTLFNSYFGRYCKSDVPGESPRGDGFPVLQVRGGVAFLCLNTGLPNTAAGKAGSAQWRAAESMLRSPEAQRLLKSTRYRVLVQHHPAQDPDVRGTPFHRQVGHGFHDWSQLSTFASENAIDLVVHGHLHVPYRARLSGSPSTLVYESGSGTLMTEDPERVARYTIFDLDDSTGPTIDGSATSPLKRTFARVWDRDRECFETRELPIPARVASDE